MDTSIDFKSYLSAKKIDPAKFKTADSTLYEELERYFEQVHPDSFTAQKLFLINPLRRKYLLEEKEPLPDSKPKAAARPKFKRP